MTDTGLVIVAFNRPAVLRAVLEVVAAHWRGPVFAQVDAPREGNTQDAVAARACRRDIQRVLGTQRLLDLWSPERNLGVARGVPAALDKAFANCDHLMVLEDDCLPHPDFFDFMPAMLRQFADDDRVMHINANTYGEQFSVGGSYGFSHLPQVWGWATWKRSWTHFRQTISDPPPTRARVAQRLPLSAPQRQELLRRWDIVADPDNAVTWDFQWQYTVVRANGLVLVPEVNLISNLGFGPEASHTHNPSDDRFNLPSNQLPPPYQAPAEITASDSVTRRYAGYMLGPSSRSRDLYRRVRGKMAGARTRVLRATKPEHHG
jgi:hypothetical protein